MSAATPPLTADGDVNKGPLILSVIWVECSVAAVILGLRIWIRTRLIRFWGWDDAVMCLAMACCVVNSALMTLAVRYGLGRHIDYLSEHDAMLANKYNWISQGFHVMATNWGKVSIALFLLRLVDRARNQRVWFYGSIALITVINSASIGSIYGQCQYPTDLWEIPRKGTCWDPSIHQSVAYFQSSFSAFSDFVLAIYPVYVIWNLQMAIRMKVAVSIVMMLGIIAMAAAIVKTVYLSQLVARSDYTFETTFLSVWLATEQYLIVIAACIPALAPLVKKARGQTSKNSNTRNNIRYGYSVESTTRVSAKQSRMQSYTSKFTRPRSMSPHDVPGYSLTDYNNKAYRNIDMTLRQDDDSEENIGERKFYPVGGIMRTTEVEVESSREAPTSFYNGPPRYRQDGEWDRQHDKEAGYAVNHL